MENLSGLIDHSGMRYTEKLEKSHMEEEESDGEISEFIIRMKGGSFDGLEKPLSDYVPRSSFDQDQ